MTYIVMAFYPHLSNIPIRTTEYTSKQEAYEYLSGVRMCETPYIAIDSNGKMFDMCAYGMPKETMIEMIQKYL